MENTTEILAQRLGLQPQTLRAALSRAGHYYGIKPTRTNEALQAWTHVLNLATNDVERQGTYLHLARVEMNTGRFTESRQHLNMVTNVDFSELKTRLEKAFLRKSGQTNDPSADLKVQPAKTP